MARDLIDMVQMLRDYAEWLAAGRCLIRSRVGRLIPLFPNVLQQRIYAAWMRQALAGKPIRQIDLKYRRAGCSTKWEALFYFIAKHYKRRRLKTLAHTDEATQEIFEIAVRMYVEDPDWPAPPAPPSTHRIAFVQNDSYYSIMTAGGSYPGSGGATDGVHATEMAKWAGDKAKIRSTVQSLFNTVPSAPQTLIGIDSTANMLDASGEFQSRWHAASAGESTYEAVFAAWFEEPSYRAEPDEDFGDLSGYEKRLVDEFGLDREQLQWRRNKIADDCNGEEIWFMQDFPATPEEAFQSPIGRVYGMLNRAAHARTYSVADLAAKGYKLIRCVDFGGVDAFVCLWLAYSRDYRPKFSIDETACPQTWRELRAYEWGKRGPKDEDNHAPDAMRYGITHLQMRGHVHVYRELYIPMAAAAGDDIVSQAMQILDMSPAGERIETTVCDKSDPLSIQLFNNRKIPATAYHCPARVRERGEIIGGIRWIQSLMAGNTPLMDAPPPPHVQELARIARADAPLPVGAAVGDLTPRVAGGDEKGGGGLEGYLD